MLREIVLDTETTGTDAKGGDRLIEIGCVELINHVQTGESFHRYVNPQRAVSEGAFAVHGLSDAFLAGKPLFSEIVDDLIRFIAGGTLVIHNAAFDVGFLNMEYARLGAAAPPAIALDEVVDTLPMARRKHPNAANSLDALCNRYSIDTTRRVKHGALLDAQILAEVYIELLGGKQTNLSLAVEEERRDLGPDMDRTSGTVTQRTPYRPRITEGERSAHAAFKASIGTTAIWHEYVSEGDAP